MRMRVDVLQIIDICMRGYSTLGPSNEEEKNSWINNVLAQQETRSFKGKVKKIRKFLMAFAIKRRTATPPLLMELISIQFGQPLNPAPMFFLTEIGEKFDTFVEESVTALGYAVNILKYQS